MKTPRLKALSFFLSICLTAYGQGLQEISSRNKCGDGPTTAISGFVVSQRTLVLIRGWGPALTKAGLSAASVNQKPLLKLYDSSGKVIASNAGWDVGLTFDQLVALNGIQTRNSVFPFDPGSKDCVIAITLDPGAYTAQLTDTSGNAGVGLIEIYKDLGSSGAVINISTRGFCGSGPSTLIAGIAITKATRVLIRGCGPVLSQFGLASKDIIQQPILTVFNQAGGQAIIERWGWDTDRHATQADIDLVKSTTSNIGTFPLPSKGGDAAIVLDLNPGTYTVHLTDGDGLTGIGLLEVYEDTSVAASDLHPVH